MDFPGQTDVKDFCLQLEFAINFWLNTFFIYMAKSCLNNATESKLKIKSNLVAAEMKMPLKKQKYSIQIYMKSYVLIVYCFGECTEQKII